MTEYHVNGTRAEIKQLKRCIRELEARDKDITKSLLIAQRVMSPAQMEECRRLKQEGNSDG